MSEAQMRELAKTNPNLYWDAINGHLPEASDEFKKVANRYPLTEDD